MRFGSNIEGMSRLVAIPRAEVAGCKTLEITVADDSADGSHNFYVAFESAEEMDAWQRAIATHAAADAVRHGCKRGAALLTRLLSRSADLEVALSPVLHLALLRTVEEPPSAARFLPPLKAGLAHRLG